MLKGVNNQSDAGSNKRRSGMRSRAPRDAACSDDYVIILGATFIVVSS
jgi:hypothetical protein